MNAASHKPWWLLTALLWVSPALAERNAPPGDNGPVQDNALLAVIVVGSNEGKLGLGYSRDLPTRLRIEVQGGAYSFGEAKPTPSTMDWCWI